MSKELFGRRLVQLRKQQRISQEELAFMVGVSVMTVRRWEHGNYGPEFDNLLKIAEVLKVEPWELLYFHKL